MTVEEQVVAGVRAVAGVRTVDGAQVGAAAQGVTAVRVRYFASAAAGAGLDEERLVVEASEPTVGDLVAAVVAAHPGLERTMALCSVLADGRLLSDPAAPLGDVDVVDVLPPFAGG